MSRPAAPNLIRDTIGDAAWKRLIAWHGGCEYNVPARLDTPAGVELASRIGAEGARKLIAWARGSRLYIAAGHDEILLARYQDILTLHEQGKTVREIAQTYDYTSKYCERTIRYVLSGGKLTALENRLYAAPELPGL